MWLPGFVFHPRCVFAFVLVCFAARLWVLFVVVRQIKAKAQLSRRDCIGRLHQDVSRGQAACSVTVNMLRSANALVRAGIRGAFRGSAFARPLQCQSPALSATFGLGRSTVGLRSFSSDETPIRARRYDYADLEYEEEYDYIVVARQTDIVDTANILATQVLDANAEIQVRWLVGFVRCPATRWSRNLSLDRHFLGARSMDIG